MKVLVTGANGFIGKNLCQRLEGAPAPHSLSWKKGIPHTDDTIEIVRLDRNGDVDVKMQLQDIMDWKPEYKIDAVIHLAARSGVRSFTDADHDNNVSATEALLKWMTREDIPMLVYASSSSVYGNSPRMNEGWIPVPISKYAHSKWTCEKLIKGWVECDQRIGIVMRLFNVIGRHQRRDMFPNLICEHLVEMAHQPSAADYPELRIFGSKFRSWTYVGDVANGFWSALDKFYHDRKGLFLIFNLGTNSSITQRTLVQMFEDDSGVKSNSVQADPNILDVHLTKADMSHFSHVFGWSPDPRNIGQGITELLQQYGLKSST